jgi:hypothetical protein
VSKRRFRPLADARIDVYADPENATVAIRAPLDATLPDLRAAAWNAYVLAEAVRAPRDKPRARSWEAFQMRQRGASLSQVAAWLSEVLGRKVTRSEAVTIASRWRFADDRDFEDSDWVAPDPPEWTRVPEDTPAR